MKNLKETIKNSIVIIDKHSGPTSHQISGWLKDIFDLKKVGHTGTLDPSVTGVLPVLLENSVKTMPLFVGLKKEYVGIMQLHKEVSRENLDKVIKKFIGKIKQTPPKKSAVRRSEREREIFSFNVIEFNGREVLFKTETEAGTYIRKLCHDMGQMLGVGAQMTELRRSKVGSFSEKNSISLLKLKDFFEIAKNGNEKYLRKFLIPIEKALPQKKKIFMKDYIIDNILNGAPLSVNGVEKIEGDLIKGETIPMISSKGELIAIGIVRMNNNEILKRKKGTAIRTDRIIKTI